MKTFTLSSFILGMMLVNLAAQPFGPAQISGTVRDTNGAPVVGIEVRLCSSFGSESTKKTDTDTDGHFLLTVINGPQRAKPFVMVRDRERNLAAACDFEEGKKAYDLQLAPALAVSGRVQDEQSKPLTNAVVNIVAWGGDMGWPIDSGNLPKIDAQGRYKIGALPVGRRYTVHATAKGYGSARSKNVERDATLVEIEPLTLRVADKKIAGVVMDSDNNPVKRAAIMIYGGDQPNTAAQTDDQGRFTIDEVCDGTVYISASLPSSTNFSSGTARAQAGDTNIVIMLSSQGTGSQPQRPSLVGKPLPDLTTAGLSPEALPANKPQLICLFDPEQRSSRRLMRLLGEQNDSLKQKGVTVVGISAALTTADALNQWKQSNPQPFPVGGVIEKNDKTKWILNTEKLPWLILTDTQGRVKAEGFDLEELDTKLK